MGASDTNTTLTGKKNVVQPLNVGYPVFIHDGKLDQVAAILRCMIAIGEEDVAHLVDEPYEVIVRKFDCYKNNMAELASLAREVVYHG